MKRNRALVLAVVTASFAVVGTMISLPASAGTAAGTVSVSATIANNCTIGASTMLFGTYDPLVANLATNLDVLGSLSIACTKGATAAIVLDAGANGTHATGTTRAMVSGGTNYLNYELYTAAARTTVWNASNTVSYVSTGKAASTVSIYGRIPSAQDANTGSYSDTVNATATF